MNKPEHWDRIKEIVGEALERAPSERAAYLAVACSGDASIRDQVESLLSAHAKAGDLSQSALIGELLDTPSESHFVGPYRLFRKLGEGGMGQVWLAEQTSPVNRKVALKLIRVGMLHSVVLQRFQSERQALAIMAHPAIAKVLDAGATASGQPYFVMEYVDGPPITEYCDQKKLSIRDRLRLFIQVCEGIQHAHQKAIIHRDIKPANILVIEVDGNPRPQIIDFGLAKTVAPPLEGETLFTQAGAFLGTPGYTSPEQTDPAVADIDTRADVYSLGVVLYELLTGALPFDAQQLKKQPLEKVLQVLREEEPPSPSTKVSTDGKNSEAQAELRGVDQQELVSLLRGDLDWITMKALERDRERRYGSPHELALDLERYLENRTVYARPASAGYRLRKYIQRHRVAVAVACGALVLLIAFVVMQGIQIRRITRERDRANRITDFMTSMFKVSDPSEARGNSVTAREILDKSSKEIETGLSHDPELQSQLMATMGQVYATLGLIPQGRSMLEKAVEIGRRTERTPSRSTLHAMGVLGFALLRDGKYADAEKVLREAVDGDRRVLGADNLETLTATRYLAYTLDVQGKSTEADKMQRESLQIAKRALGPEHWETLLSMNVMANILDDERKLPEAEELYRQTLSIQQRTLGTDHPDTLTTASNLAAVMQEQGRLEEAEKLERETLATRLRVLGPDHPDSMATKLNLGNTLDSEGRYPEAEKLYLETIAVQTRVLGAESPDTLMTTSNLGNTLRREGRYAEAEKLQRQTLEIKRRVIGADNPETKKAAGELAATLSSSGKYEEAKKYYSARMEELAKSGNTGDLENGWYDFACGAALAGQKDEALEYLRQAIEHGYTDFAHIRIDDDLKSLRGDSRFENLLHDAETRAASNANGPAAH